MTEHRHYALEGTQLRPRVSAFNIQRMPGMPVEVFLKTDERTPLDYLTQPLTSYFKRAFREE